MSNYCLSDTIFCLSDDYTKFIYNNLKNIDTRTKHDAACHFLAKSILLNNEMIIAKNKKDFLDQYIDSDIETKYNAGCNFLKKNAIIQAKFKKDAIKLFYWSAKEGNINARSELKKIAEEGNAYAQFYLGSFYEIIQYIKKSVGFYYLSAKQENKKALIRLAIIAEKNSYAQYYLALCYENGFGVAKDIGKALELFNSSAREGNAKAQYHLAKYFEKVEKNMVLAFQLLNSSAEKGNAKALYRLGTYYDKVEKNIVKAKEYYTESAKKGHKFAQFDLGCCYLNEKHMEIAFKWLTLSANQGVEEAKNVLNTHYPKESLNNQLKIKSKLN